MLGRRKPYFCQSSTYSGASVADELQMSGLTVKVIDVRVNLDSTIHQQYGLELRLCPSMTHLRSWTKMTVGP